MKKVSRGTESSEIVLNGLVAAWGIGGITIVAAELVVTGHNVLDAGVSWQSWAVGGLAAIFTFSFVVAWGRRNSRRTGEMNSENGAQYD